MWLSREGQHSKLSITLVWLLQPIFLHHTGLSSLQHHLEKDLTNKTLSFKCQNEEAHIKEEIKVFKAKAASRPWV